VVFGGLFFLSLLGDLFGIFVVGLAGFARHVASWYNVDKRELGDYSSFLKLQRLYCGLCELFDFSYHECIL
jgi:hypothetical protein